MIETMFVVSIFNRKGHFNVRNELYSPLSYHLAKTIQTNVRE
jgi:hypothetical protein